MTQMTQKHFDQMQTLAEDVAGKFIDDFKFVDKEQALAALNNLKECLKRELQDSIMEEVAEANNF